MRMVDFIFHLFRGKSSVCDMVLLSDIVPVPKRSDISDPFDLEKIDDYKKRYLSKLLKRETVTSKQLEDVDFRQEIDMYRELLLKIMKRSSIKEDFQKRMIDKEEWNLLEKRISIRKLDRYYFQLLSLERSLILHLVALEEVQKTHFFFPSKRNILKEEIDHLMVAYQMIQGQKEIIPREVDTYLKEIKMSSITEVSSEIIDNRYRELESMMSILLESIVLPEDKLDAIVLMEERLETYFYQHRNKKKEFLLELKQVQSKNNTDSITYYEIESLEQKGKMIACYDYSGLEQKEIEDFYAFKFDAVTKRGQKLDSNHFTEVEYRCYQKIIEEKVSLLLRGVLPPYYHGLLTSQTVAKALSIYLKDENHHFSPSYILENQNLLQFILAFEKEDGLEQYFRTTMVSKEDYDREYYEEMKKSPDFRKWKKEHSIAKDKVVDFHNELFSYSNHILVNRKQDNASKVSLHTVYSMAYYNREDCSDILYPIFKELMERRKNDVFMLPDGITEIHYDSEKIKENDLQFLRTIEEYAKASSCFKMPPWLEFIRGPVFQNMRVQNLYLNEGLMEISTDAFREMEGEEVYFPSSLMKQSGFYHSTFHIVHINNYQTANYKEILSPFFAIWNVEPFEGIFHRLIQGNYFTLKDRVVEPLFSKLVLEEHRVPKRKIERACLIYPIGKTYIEWDKSYLSNPNYSSIDPDNLKKVLHLLDEVVLGEDKTKSTDEKVLKK